MATATLTWPFIGHDPLGRQLLSSLHADTMPAVMLMIGPAHVGKASAARWLVQADVCDTKQACGHCLSCRQVIAGEHPSVVDIVPNGDRIGVEDIRQALRRWSTAPTADEHRWLIISDLERLHESGGNALLKFLEDLPRQTRVIMTTSRLADTLATLQSRAAVYRWHLVSTKLIDAWLEKRFLGLSTSVRSAIAFRSAGRPGQAMAMAESGQTDVIDFEQMLRTYRDPDLYLQRQAPEHPEAQLELVTLGIREILMSYFEAQRRLWPETGKSLVDIQTGRTPEAWLTLLQRAVAAVDLLNHNAQPRLVLNDLLLV